MVKASALYIVVIVSVILAVLSISVISVAFYYRMDYHQKMRFDKLSVNLESAAAIVLSESFEIQDELKKRLYEDKTDSVILSKFHWGVYELNNIYAFEQGDTLRKSFISGSNFTDPSTLYLIDEDRPVNISGDTKLIGDVEIPESGIRQAYVDGVGYDGKREVEGQIRFSKRTFPELDHQKLDYIYEMFKVKGENFDGADSISNSFFNPVRIVNLSPGQVDIDRISLKGRVILISDSLVRIGEGTVLDNVLIFSPVIEVANGVTGTCQFFAQDSIRIGKDCVFTYPSFAGVFKTEDNTRESKLTIMENVLFDGTLMTYSKSTAESEPTLSIAKGTVLNGQVFSSGPVLLEAPIRINGKTTARKVLMKKKSLIYDNYLIDVILDRKELNEHYLNPAIFTVQDGVYDVVKWLN